MKKLIFFIIASALLLFSIIVVNIAPAINGLINGSIWSQQSCSLISDYYDNYDKNTNPTTSSGKEEKEAELDLIKKWRSRCNNRKAMVGLEYVTSNLNIVFGCICALLGFLHFINVGNMGKYIGLIGLGVGVIGFVLTFVYVIESGLVFNDVAFDFDDYLNINANGCPNSSEMKTDSDGAFLEKNGNKYTCIYYKKDDRDSVYARYSDYGKKYFNYHKDLYYPEGDKQYIFPSSQCTSSSTISWAQCKIYDESKNSYTRKYTDGSGNLKDCEKVYYTGSMTTNNEKKVIYDRWLTTIIFSCFIILLNIGLAIFGFLLFRESGGSSGSVAIK